MKLAGRMLVLARHFILLSIAVAFSMQAAGQADPYADTIQVFRNAEASNLFDSAYGYAVFRTIGKAGIGVGGAHGKGRVYEQDRHIGNTSMTQLTIGFQLGGQAYSQIIFFQDKRALQEFTHGNFEFGAQATAVAITAGVSASASTTGHSASISGGKNDAATTGVYYKGTAIYTVAKGGLMYEASVGGQKFRYRAL